MISKVLVIAIALLTSTSLANAQVATPRANNSFITQIGDFNTAIVAQAGGANSQTTLQGAGDTSARAKLLNGTLLTDGPSFNNIASTTQVATSASGASNTSTTIQLGPGSNVSGVMQLALASGTNHQVTIQSGFGNVADTTQVAHASLTNASTTLQVGSHNTATVSQK